MTFREDESRIRKGNGDLAFNILRKIVLNLFRQDTTMTASMHVRKKELHWMMTIALFYWNRLLTCASRDC